MRPVVISSCELRLPELLQAPEDHRLRDFGRTERRVVGSATDRRPRLRSLDGRESMAEQPRVLSWYDVHVPGKTENEDSRYRQTNMDETPVEAGTTAGKEVGCPLPRVG